MIYCEKQPYFKNSLDYFHDHVNHYEILYDDWILKKYRAVLISKLGSYSEVEYHWKFNSEADRTFFMMVWA